MDNALNRVSVPASATCDQADVRVDVTLGGVAFSAVASAPVVRLAAVATTARALPSGSAGLASVTLYPLPCDAGHERVALASVATLTDGTQRAIPAAHLAYASSAPPRSPWTGRPPARPTRPSPAAPPWAARRPSSTRARGRTTLPARR